MKNNLNCNGCRYTVEKNRIACDCCVDRSNYSPRQRIRYGEDLDADIYTAIQKAMTNLSVTGTFMPAIENVMFKDPATIVFWDDGDKTVVKCQPGDTFSAEAGLTAAMLKKYMGNDNTFNKVINEWLARASYASVPALPEATE